jgi:hypothetical protein
LMDKVLFSALNIVSCVLSPLPRSHLGERALRNVQLRLSNSYIVGTEEFVFTISSLRLQILTSFRRIYLPLATTY